jgi:2-polyprenyl-3-methyl-5-hydroxy-6-metoxy-1,4-benzoquinol methylase
MSMFGSEQAYAHKHPLLRLSYRWLGETRYSMRMRGIYLRRLLRSLEDSPRTIWDAGCGTGQITFMLGRLYPNASIIGTDILDQAVYTCRQIAQRQGITRLSFEQSNLLESQMRDQFNMVVCFEVLEHIDDYQAALQRLAAALRDNGRLIIHTPAAGKYTSDTFGLRRICSNRQQDTRPIFQRHARPGFEREALHQAIQKVGLEIELSRYTFGELAMHAHTIYEITRHRTALRLLTFPILIMLGVVDAMHQPQVGGGLLICARKRSA